MEDSISVRCFRPINYINYYQQFPYDPIATNLYAQPYPSYPCGFAAPGTYPCHYYGPLNQVINATMTPNISNQFIALPLMIQNNNNVYIVLALPTMRYSDGVPNFNATQSIVPNGSDLPRIYFCYSD